ncbi:YiiX family permuted papain-like enzyme [Niastella yeongjuensis]|nr:YiiX family permuted papain-like enzyme [Niastella yeongjuensis]SEP18837.1 Permuted papain-like amidase enzyme, YaeF/YiiX, C92 family [Niastella yeongjuensis]
MQEISNQKRLKGVIIVGIISLLMVSALYSLQKSEEPARKTINTNNKITLLDEGKFKNGDIIFQTSLSQQSKAIQLATKSKYSHCGLIFKNGQNYYVFEAVQPVKITPLDKWIARGQDGKYVVKRLINADQILTDTVIENMKQVCNRLKGKNYDLTFEWSDERIYCSELIWKVYKRGAHIDIGKLEKLSNFDLDNKVVKGTMNKRYGDNIPMNETVISPVAIFKSDLLTTVISNY